MKFLILGVAALLGLAACGSDEEDRLSRGSAIAQIQNTVPGVTYEEADFVIDRICGYFEEGWGAGYITNNEFQIPRPLQEDFAHVILLSAQTACPQNVVDARGWQDYNGWED